jgi:hypothetical protein
MQYLAKNQSTQRCQSLITQGSDHLPVLEPRMVLTLHHVDVFTLEKEPERPAWDEKQGMDFCK